MPGEQRAGAQREAWSAALVGLALLVPYALLHLRWLPGPDALVGHDWSYVMPRLLAASYWLEVTGPFQVAWFTPAFLGGTPLAAHPASPYFSLLQAAHELAGPLAAARGVLLLGAFTGFLGTWLLARRACGASHAAALLAATVFAWNGFHATRLLAGHAGFHGSMLLPLAAWWLLRPLDPARPRTSVVRDGVLCGATLAYQVLSGNVYGLPPMILALAALAAAGVLRGASARAALARAACAALFALCVCGAKLWAGLAFLAHAPRAGYPLPGFDGVLAAAAGVARALFLAPPAQGGEARLVNTGFAIGGHELDFGVTWVPAALVLAALVAGPGARGALAAALRARPAAALALALALAVPFAVNVHGQGWTAFLKSLPVLASSSNLLRWLWTYVPLAAVAAALALDALPIAARHRTLVAALACAAVLTTHALRDAGAHVERAYDPARIESAARRVREQGEVPAITRNDVVWNARGEPTSPVGRDDLLVDGASQLLAYEPLFGYRLEWFPMGALRPGDPFESRDGHLNAKDPASFLFPALNGGAPGAHFQAADRARLAAFLEYRPLAWRRPLAFDVLAVLAALSCAAGSVFVLWTARAPRLRDRT
ncbi:MAG: hypothetical protein JNK02_07175 [Planctomycetes bacterium]|nr:hypothetical protein [Planctomycetota bacterium]